MTAKNFSDRFNLAIDGEICLTCGSKVAPSKRMLHHQWHIDMERNTEKGQPK